MEEFVDLVDENDRFVKKMTRKEADEKVLRRRAARIIILNKDNQFLIQKRSTTQTSYPNYWDVGMAEGVLAGESYESSAVRGLKEELNIVNISNLDLLFLFKLKFDNEKTSRWYKVFSLVYNGEMKIDKDEVAEIKFVTEDILNGMVKNESFVPAGLKVYKKYIEELKMRK